MDTEVYIENYRLDISKEISTLLNFAIDDIKDFSARSTTWSKTIVLPGSANNNKLFGHIFDISQSNFYNPDLPNVAYNFNASKSADCVIFQDNLQTFKGVLRLLEVISDKGNIEYEVAVFGEMTSLNVALSSKRLEDLDFSEYNEPYTVANIIASWDNPGGSGLYYPLIDYGAYSDDKHNWDFRTLRPALYAKEYIDKMFENADFRYNSDLFNTDRFKKLIIPNNRKAVYTQDSQLLNLTVNAASYVPTIPSTQFHPIVFTILDGLDRFSTTDNKTFTYTGIVPYKTQFNFSARGDYFSIGEISVFSFQVNDEYVLPLDSSGGYLQLNPTPDHNLVDYSVTGSVAVSLNPGDTIKAYFVYSFTQNYDYQINVASGEASIEVGPTESSQVVYGETLDINYNLPKNIRQIDFLVSIVKLYNLYVYEDRFNERLIHIKPFIDYYSKSVDDIIDWTYKLDRNKPIRLKPMSELNAKIYEFKYKSDSDFWNDLYKKRYGEDYGNRIFDSEFEFSEQKKSLEVIFSPTPLVGYTNKDKIYPTIFKRNGVVEEQIDSNIRILQSKKITGVTSWELRDNGDLLTSATSYGYAGHLDDPDAPSNDLNFGAPKELFFTLASGDLSPNQFNVYWSDYMAEITDKDSKLLTGKFYLTPKDIYNLDFSKYISLDGVLFRINKISDYNASNPDICTVELFRALNTDIKLGGDSSTLCQAVISLSPAQVTNTSGNIVVDGITLSSVDGVITIDWNATLQTSFGTHPAIWAYFDGQMQSMFVGLDNQTSPSVITIDLGTIPSSDTYITIPCANAFDIITFEDDVIVPPPVEDRLDLMNHTDKPNYYYRTSLGPPRATLAADGSIVLGYHDLTIEINPDLGNTVIYKYDPLTDSDWVVLGAYNHSAPVMITLTSNGLVQIGGTVNPI